MGPPSRRDALAVLYERHYAELVRLAFGLTRDWGLAGSLWGTGNYGGVERVDPATGRVTATIRLPDAVRVTFWAGSAWASDDQTGTVARIDPASNRIVGKAAPAGTSPIYIAPGAGGLWVVDFTTGELLHLALASAVK